MRTVAKEVNLVWFVIIIGLSCGLKIIHILAVDRGIRLFTFEQPPKNNHMKNWIPLIVILICSFESYSQKFAPLGTTGKNNEIEFQYKWKDDKSTPDKEDKIILIQVINHGPTAVDFEASLRFFKNMKLAEESAAIPLCIPAGKKLSPKKSGLIFKPNQLKPSEVESIELSEIEVNYSEYKECVVK
jgi:hypothetical protein